MSTNSNPDFRRVLRIAMHGQPVGQLLQGQPADRPAAEGRRHAQLIPVQGWMQFVYDSDWLKRPDAVPLSQHLPLQSAPHDHWHCLSYFGGLLPQGGLRHALARQLQLDTDDIPGLLLAIGHDCLGAVSVEEAPAKRLTPFWMHTLVAPKPTSGRQPLAEPAPAAEPTMLDASAGVVLSRPAGRRASWPGVGSVVPLWQDDAEDASSHLLWMAAADQPAELLLRAASMQLLQHMGIAVQIVQWMPSEAMHTLLLARSDRHVDETGRVHRLHAETMAQALGLAPDATISRQVEGWGAAFRLLRACAQPSVLPVLQLLDQIIALVLLGDADASLQRLLLVRRDGRLQVAPLWDACSTLVPHHGLPVPPARMALPIGRHSHATLPGDEAWNQWALACGLSPQQVRKRVSLLAQRMVTALNNLAQLQPSADAALWQQPVVRQLDKALRARIGQMSSRKG